MVSGVVLFPFLIGTLHLHRKASGKISVGSIIQLVLTVAVMVFLLIFMKKGHAFMALLWLVGSVFFLILVWFFLSKNCNPFESRPSAIIFKCWFYLVTIVLVFAYALDYEHYDYLNQRLSASVMNYADDAKISMGMIWETYPVVRLFLFIIISCILIIWGIRKVFSRVSQSNASPNLKLNFIYSILFIALLISGIFGRFGQYPLRWSDAFALKDDFKANLALNPMQSFFSTLQFRNSGYNLDSVKKYYPLIASYLQVKDTNENQLTFTRVVPGNDSIRRNVVIVICESFSAYKSTMFGNKLNTTPYFNQMCREGVFFDRCFTPSYGTARGVWATLTGTPDVEYPNTSSRNPAYVNQHSIINDFTNYSKYYFIGGSTSWANIRGLLTNNISDLHLLEEEDFNAKKIDVWGISDKRLFLAANDTFAARKNPFVAVIQTADNHRPYTIPEEDRQAFSLESFPTDTLAKYGFASNEELNAFRYMDFAFKTFIEAAKKEAYFKNTIFVFVGDHGIPGNARAEFPETWNRQGLTIHHVPLLFYAPDILKSQLISDACSQSDVLPSAAFLAGVPYTNTSMGINLFDSSEINTHLPFRNAAFIFDPTIKQIGIVTDSFVYNHNLISKKESASRLYENTPINTATEDELRQLATGWYQTARYLLANNKKISAKGK